MSTRSGVGDCGAGRLKRMAAQIASQLPENDREALIVLNYVREIICNLGAAWEVPSAMTAAREPLKLVSAAPGRRDREASLID